MASTPTPDRPILPRAVAVLAAGALIGTLGVASERRERRLADPETIELTADERSNLDAAQAKRERRLERNRSVNGREAA